MGPCPHFPGKPESDILGKMRDAEPVRHKASQSERSLPCGPRAIMCRWRRMVVTNVPSGGGVDDGETVGGTGVYGDSLLSLDFVVNIKLH